MDMKLMKNDTILFIRTWLSLSLKMSAKKYTSDLAKEILFVVFWIFEITKFIID